MAPSLRAAPHTGPILGIYSMGVSTPKETILQNHANSGIEHNTYQSIVAIKTMTKHSLEEERTHFM